MGKEIERKFIVRDASYKKLANGRREISQGYLSTTPEATVRLRIADDTAYITIKSRNHGAERGEWEYPIPATDARSMLAACGIRDIISKTRWLVPAPGGLVWEVDEFHGALAPLVLAEIELPRADMPLPEPLPSFVGREVTGDAAYYNSNLIKGLPQS